MRQLLRKPFLLALILSLPLWIVFSNYIVALCTGLLLAFLCSMLETMLALREQETRERTKPRAQDRPSGDSSTNDLHR